MAAFGVGLGAAALGLAALGFLAGGFVAGDFATGGSAAWALAALGLAGLLAALVLRVGALASPAMHCFLTWKGVCSPFRLPQSSHMTGLEMNGQARIPFSRPMSAVALVLGVLSLGACASASGRQLFADVPVNPTSPAKAEIEAVLAKPGPFPTFADIPTAPADLPTADSIKAEVEEQQTEARYVTNSTAPETWNLDASEAFAARAMADAKASDVSAPTDAEIAESERFIAAAKARAKAPPKPK